MTVSQNDLPNEDISQENESQDKRVPYHFGEKLRTVRERKGYTLKVVATQAGVSESLVSQIERNRVSPAIDTLLALADVLDINLEYLFEEYRRKHPVRDYACGYFGYKNNTPLKCATTESYSIHERLLNTVLHRKA